MSDDRFFGIVDWYRDDQGYGVIKGEDGKEYFVHSSNVRCGELAPRMRVSYMSRVRTRGRGGWEAYDVDFAPPARDVTRAREQPKRPTPAASVPAVKAPPRPKQVLPSDKPHTIPVVRPAVSSSPSRVQPEAKRASSIQDHARQAAEEALRRKLARRQGTAPPEDAAIQSGTRVTNPQWGEGTVVYSLPGELVVRFDLGPDEAVRLPITDCVICRRETVRQSEKTARREIEPQIAPGASGLSRLMYGMRREVQETLSDEGFEDVEFVYRYVDKADPPEAPRQLDLDDRVRQLFRSVQGIDTFYSHQREAREQLLAGRHVMICTPTASGKTESYNPTILETLLRNPQANALYIFPLVALGADQMERLQRLNGALPPDDRLEIGIYNSTVDQATKRRVMRAHNRILVTTPESFHYLFLPKPYPNWQNYYRNLRYVVLDEAHVYRGVLGANMANIVRRLLIRCRREGNAAFPQIIISSATVRKPRALASQLTGLPESDFAIIDSSGAPQPARHYLVTRSDIHHLTGVCAELMELRTKEMNSGRERPLRTIAFLSSINGVKRATDELQRALRNQGHADMASRVASYYSEKLDKQDVFAALRRGEISCIFTTNALMAGIDIGSLDVAIVEGFPRKVMDARQMFGRAGRVGEGAAIFIARPNDPFDQFYFQRPDILFSGETEDVVANPENPFLLVAHVSCAAQVANGSYSNREGPLPLEWASLFGPMGHDIVNSLVASGVLQGKGASLYLGPVPDPHDREPLKNLRALASDEYVLRRLDGQELERKREETAYRDAHPGALIWVDGTSYKVKALDREAKTIECEPLGYTEFRTQGTQTRDIVFDSSSLSRQAFGPLALPMTNGKANVATEVKEYRLYHRTPMMQCRRRSCRHKTPVLETRQCPKCGGPMRLREEEESVETRPLETPLATELETRAIALALTAPIEAQFDRHFWPRWYPDDGADENGLVNAGPTTAPTFFQAAHGMLHAVMHAIPELIRCDEDEIMGFFERGADTNPAILYIYDNFPAGLGLADEVYAEPQPVLKLALDVVERCICDDDSGCPVCLSYFACSEFNQALSKFGARYLLRSVLGYPTDGVLDDLRDYATSTIPRHRIAWAAPQHGTSERIP